MTHQQPVYELQTYDWTSEAWKTRSTYDTDGDDRAEDNAYFAYTVCCGTGPHRLLKDGATVAGVDDPASYYAD
ncbi:hypothetical protein ACH492_22400 [Streptomyces sp. NPDC019443]|uniref:hypothetical protein n=1 Tax=Streptomyces sp. NPDC019443 TaxID=3365061 RepID=UPI00379B2893